VNDADREVMGLILTTNAELLAGVLRGRDDSSVDPLMAALAAARSLSVIVDDILRALVRQARSEERTWAEIGEVLHVSRQAVFQRFGGSAGLPPPALAGEDTIMTPAGGTPVAGADSSGRSVMQAFLDQRWEDVRADFDERMTSAGSVDLLKSAWTRVSRDVGGFQEMGTPSVHVMEGYTVVDIPLSYERGDRKGRVVFDADERVAGFFMLPAES
jgi:hypothetical protein